MNRYSPYYSHDEDRACMTIDNEGSWVHITAHRKREARLAEAEAIIDELDAHEGAEGWSQDLKDRLVRFRAADSAPPPSQPFAAEEIIARAYCRLQAADVPRDPWHWEVSKILNTTPDSASAACDHSMGFSERGHGLRCNGCGDRLRSDSASEVPSDT